MCRILTYYAAFLVTLSTGTVVRAGTCFRYQYGIAEPSFSAAQVCVDFDNDGAKEIIFAPRADHTLEWRRADDGKLIRGIAIPGDYQSVCAYDIDADGVMEILYTTSGPGRLYVLDRTGKILRTWDSGDDKLGNSPVILDGDGDGVLDGYFGTRNKQLVRMNMSTLAPIYRRDDWVQCGCYTSAIDVDHDGRWDLFAGSGDDHGAARKGSLHRFDPASLADIWSYKTNDNASSADAVLVDIDGDGRVEVIKSVDNYARDDAHDAVYAFTSDGSMLWKVDGLSGEDSPNVADLDGDGKVEIVGMTFGGEVYCLDSTGRVKWRKDLRPEHEDSAHAYMAPILCDTDGDRDLEILAMTNGPNNPKSPNSDGIVFALSADGEILDRLNVGGFRYWGHAFLCNVDDDPYTELVVSGSGGLDCIETRGFGPQTEVFQRRRTYQRLNVIPWAYEDSYFIRRGTKSSVVNRTDDLVLGKEGDDYRAHGTFTTELLTAPPRFAFHRLRYGADTPRGTELSVDVLNATGTVIRSKVANGASLRIAEPVRLRFRLATSDRSVTPRLDAYALAFDRFEPVPDKLVVLTFDDSVASHHSIVRPILKRYGFGATFFITEGFSFATNKQDYMTWEQIAELHADGFEIGNHTRDHMGVSAKTIDRLAEQLEAINAQCEKHRIPRPVSFAYPGNGIDPGALDVLAKLGIRFARRGGAPEYSYESGRGHAYEPGLDHPLLIPSVGDARPDWTLDDFKRAVHLTGDGKIAVLQFHGAPDRDHPWVHTPPERFEQYMKYLHDNHYRVIALRDLAGYVDAAAIPSDPWAVIRARQQRLEKK